MLNDVLSMKSSHALSRLPYRTPSPGLSTFTLGKGDAAPHSACEDPFFTSLVTPSAAASAAAVALPTTLPIPRDFALEFGPPPPSLHPLLNGVPAPAIDTASVICGPSSIPINTSDLLSLRQFARGVSNTLIIAILNDKFNLKDLHKLEPKFNSHCKHEERKEIFGSDGFSFLVTVDKSSPKKPGLISKESFAAAFAVYAEIKNHALPNSYIFYNHFAKTILAYEKAYGWSACWEYTKAVFESQ
jgi:hypothetical protein